MAPTARHLTLALAGALVVWLLLDRQGGSALRQGRLEAALAAGTLGVLTGAERDFFSRAFQVWATAAGIEEPVRFDRPFEPGALHVFSTRPAAAEVTGNEAGNGLYDRGLDAIFLDRSLFRSPDVAYLYADIRIAPYRAEQPVLDGYLLFVFLHELGHRELHRGRWAGAGPDREREADEFVLEVLRGADPAVLQEAPPRYSAPFIPWGSRDPADEPFLALTGSIFHTTYVLLYSDGPFSPLRRGVTHPAFLQRAMGLLRSAAPLAGSSVATRFVRLAEDSLRRLERTASHPMAEVRTPFPIAAAGFSARDLVIFEDEEGTVGAEHRLPLVSLGGGSCGQSVCAVDWAPADSRRRPDGPPVRFARILPSREPAIDVATSKGVFRAEEDRWREWPGDEAPAVLTGGGYRVVANDTRVAAPGPKSWRTVDGDRTLGEIRSSDLTRAAGGAAADGGLKLEPIAVGREGVSFLVQDGLEIRGVVETDLAGASPRYSSLRVDHEDFRPEPVWARQVSVCAPKPSHEILAVTSTRTRENVRTYSSAYEIEVWRLSPANPPKRLAAHPMWVDALGGPDDLREIQWVSVPIISVEAVPGGGGLLIDVYLGSTYYFDCAKQRLEMVFHPGGLESAMAPSGKVAFFARGGNKVFVRTFPIATSVVDGPR